VHLLDGFLYTQTGTISTFEQRGTALEVLKRLTTVIQAGTEQRHFQRLPHSMNYINNPFLDSRYIHNKILL
jgi:hypothetical protein